MPRRKQGINDEIAEIGRIAGLVKRADPNLFETLKQEAEEKGLNLSEYIVQLLNSARKYDVYADVDAATIMKVMDILDRMQTYMLQWMTNTSSQHLLDHSLATLQVLVQLSEMLSPMLGYKKQEEIQKLIEQVRQEAQKEVMEKMRKRGIVSDAVEKLVDKVVDSIVQEAVKTLKDKGVLEELAQLVSSTTEETVNEYAGEGVE